MVIRGMLPRKTAKGKSALKRLRVFVGNPGGDSRPMSFEEADSKRLGGRFITVGELLSNFGWKNQGKEESE